MKYITILLMLAITVGACNQSNNFSGQGRSTGENENSTPVYLWPEGKKYYYTFDEKRYLDEVPNKVVLGLDEKYLSEIQLYLQKNDQIRNMELNHHEGRFCIYILTTTENADVSTFMEDLKKLTGVKSVHPSYILADFISPEISVIDEIIMCFKDHVSQQEINEMHKKYPVEVKEITPYWQILSVPVSADLLGIANAYQESGLTIYSKPSFISETVVGP